VDLEVAELMPSTAYAHFFRKSAIISNHLNYKVGGVIKPEKFPYNKHFCSFVSRTNGSLLLPESENVGWKRYRKDITVTDKYGKK
jgi:hypothetical protein